MKPNSATISRNAPCFCGSKRRYKDCHGAIQTALSAESLNEADINEADTLAVPKEHMAKKFAEKGLTAQRKGDLSIAVDSYRKALKIWPDFPDALHMLGVVQMQQFEYKEALELIEQAGTLTGWKYPTFRHNFGYLLSAYIGGRVPHTLEARKKELVTERKAYRKQLASLTSQRMVFILDAVDTTPAQMQTTLSSIAMIYPAALYPEKSFFVLGPSSLSNYLTEYPRARLVSLVDGLRHALNDCLTGLKATDIAFLIRAGSSVTVGLGAAMKAFNEVGAQWTLFNGTVAETEAIESQKMYITLVAAFSRMNESERIGNDFFYDESQKKLARTSAWRVGLMKDCAQKMRANNWDGLIFSALWSSEPAFEKKAVWVISLDQKFVENESIQFTESESTEDALMQYLELAVSNASPPNQLAPSLATDGIGFLKRPLRHGMGAKMTADMLLLVRDLIVRDKGQYKLRSDGAEFVGLARMEVGLGESMRLLVRAATSVGVNCAAANIALNIGIRQSDTTIDHLLVSDPVFDKQIICVNPDWLGEAVNLDGVGRNLTTYRIGYWYWELDRFPKPWVEATKLIDELWVSSEYVASAARQATNKPVVIIPPPLLTPPLSRPFSKQHFDLDENKFAFLFSFAYSSFDSRKNPGAVVKAFRMAFPNLSTKVQLLIKSSQAEMYPKEVEKLRQLAAGDPRIRFIHRYLTKEELTGLQTACDSYVSLHRSEGLGLGLAEAMSLGKPVIGTGYSGNLEFMNERNSLLVDYRIVKCKPSDYIMVDQTLVWAEPDIASAAKHMRFLFENPQAAHALGRTAKADIATRFSLEASGQKIRARLQEIDRLRGLV